MSIKSDKWIKKMSINEDMINPFSENQVRLDESGNKLISYGVSSYGYDVRCSSQFKVFTNINSAVVDPKILIKTVFLILKVRHVLFRQIHLRLHLQLNILRFQGLF